jgi:hypothetical protein
MNPNGLNRTWLDLKTRRAALGVGILSALLPAFCLSMTACNTTPPGGKAPSTAVEAPPLSLEVSQVDQRVRLGDKTPDGQYLVTKVTIKNLSNQSRILNPPDFLLQNQTENEKERYSQPAEKFLGFAFAREYGTDAKDKLVDIAPMNAYPRLQLERYFVFMVPADAKPDQYRIFYKPLSLSAPLVSGKTIIHDHRYDNPVTPKSP